MNEHQICQLALDHLYHAQQTIKSLTDAGHRSHHFDNAMQLIEAARSEIQDVSPNQTTYIGHKPNP